MYSRQQMTITSSGIYRSASNHAVGFLRNYEM